MRSIVEEALSRKRFEDVARDDSPVSAIFDAETETEIASPKQTSAPAQASPAPTPRAWPAQEAKPVAQKPLFSSAAAPAPSQPAAKVDLSSQYKFTAPKTTAAPGDDFDDDELDKILESLQTKITVVGCGICNI